MALVPWNVARQYAVPGAERCPQLLWVWTSRALRRVTQTSYSWTTVPAIVLEPDLDMLEAIERVERYAQKGGSCRPI